VLVRCDLRLVMSLISLRPFCIVFGSTSFWYGYSSSCTIFSSYYRLLSDKRTNNSIHVDENNRTIQKFFNNLNILSFFSFIELRNRFIVLKILFVWELKLTMTSHQVLKISFIYFHSSKYNLFSRIRLLCTWIENEGKLHIRLQIFQCYGEFGTYYKQSKGFGKCAHVHTGYLFTCFVHDISTFA